MSTQNSFFKGTVMDEYNQNIESDNNMVQQDGAPVLACDDPNIPYGWRYKLAIKNKQVKQAKLFKVLVAEQNKIDNLPSIRHD